MAVKIRNKEKMVDFSTSTFQFYWNFYWMYYSSYFFHKLLTFRTITIDINSWMAESPLNHIKVFICIIFYNYKRAFTVQITLFIFAFQNRLCLSFVAIVSWSLMPITLPSSTWTRMIIWSFSVMPPISTAMYSLTFISIFLVSSCLKQIQR